MATKRADFTFEREPGIDIGTADVDVPAKELGNSLFYCYYEKVDIIFTAHIRDFHLLSNAIQLPADGGPAVRSNAK